MIKNKIAIRNVLYEIEKQRHKLRDNAKEKVNVRGYDSNYWQGCIDAYEKIRKIIEELKNKHG